MKVLNLDAYSGEDVKIRLNGRDYIIPSQLSTEYIFMIWDNAQKIQEEADKGLDEADEKALQELMDGRYKIIHEIFCMREQNEVSDFDKFKRLFNSEQLIVLSKAIINTFNIDEVVESIEIEKKKKKVDSGRKGSRKQGMVREL